METSRNTEAKYINPVITGALLFICLPVSAFFLAEGYSFLHFFDQLNGETRVAAPLIMLGCLVLFCLTQMLGAALLAEGLLVHRGRVLPLFAGLFAAASGAGFLYLLCGELLPGPALMAVSFLPGGLVMASSYLQGEHKAKTILKASFGSFLVLAAAMLCSSLFFEGGVAEFFTGLIDRIKNSMSLYCDDAIEQMILSAGGKEELAELLAASGTDLSAEGLTIDSLLAEYREAIYLAATGSLLLAPSVLFCIYTCSYYGSYAFFRLMRRLCKDGQRKPLLMSPFVAGVYALCVLIYTFWSIFVGGGGVLILLVINLIVMLTPGLAVMGIKCVRPLFSGAFKRNKLMALFCIVLILLNPFMALAAYGCYGIIGGYVRSVIERRTKR